MKNNWRINLELFHTKVQIKKKSLEKFIVRRLAKRVMSDKQADAMRLKYLRSLHLINPEDPVTIKKKENIIPDPAITTETPTLDQPQLMYLFLHLSLDLKKNFNFPFYMSISF